jgi:hypothetical protein
VSTFFAAYDALCEEGLASTVTKSLTEIADTSLPGSFLPLPYVPAFVEVPLLDCQWSTI